MLTAFTFLAVLFGPTVWVIVSCLMLWRERRREAQVKPSGAWTTSGTGENRPLLDIEGVELACGLMIPVTTVVLGIIAFALGSIPSVELVVAMATVASVVWWLRLRRHGVRHAEVYAIFVWLGTRFAWSAVILMDANDGTAFLFCPADEVRGVECGIVNQFGGTTFLILAAAVAFVASLTALILTRFAPSSFNPSIPLVLASPYVALFWFTTPLGFAHAAFTLAVVRYAISREMRRIGSEGAFGPTNAMDTTTGSRPHFRLSVLTLSPSTLPSTIAVGFFVAVGVVALVVAAWRVVANLSEFGLVEFLAVQAMAVGAGGLLVLTVMARKGKAMRYGAMLLGFMWMLLMVLIFDAPNLTRIAPPWALEQYVATTIGAAIVVAAMWQAFGPGAVDTPSSNDV